MFKPWQWLAIAIAGFGVGMGLGKFSQALTNQAVLAQTETPKTYPDVATDYWASSYIQALSSRGILKGYPDNTYRPEKIVDRDEYAAVLRQAFSPETVRAIPSGSIFADVPQNYWASQPIEEVYEKGFMQDFSPESQRLFKPKNEVSRLEALLALYRGLELEYEAPQPQPQAQAPAPTNRPVAPQQLAFPMAFTTLIPSFLVSQPAQATAPQPQSSSLSAREYVQQRYEDAAQVPEDALSAIAALSQNDIIVNHSNSQQLNLQEPLTRGTTAALIYRALAAQGKVDPATLTGENPDVVTGQ
ncbi:MAG: S-layer homology domain-containing protein [Jaaginema sp. PMC 1079.18]|nr:S-layer homology domain-containing protein [Jaaginema sp. PMC 1080.18]MEC4851012.1 S-layer homology domain-containing protein [Jaaginema sp. PMC 1079.18]MEC4868763.1 S-layer homology domain-containing protein [Jaaginema sp. PMC 1078.18]